QCFLWALALHQITYEHCAHRETGSGQHHSISDSVHPTGICNIHTSMKNSGHRKTHHATKNKNKQADVSNEFPQHVGTPSWMRESVPHIELSRFEPNVEQFLGRDGSDGCARP